MPHIQTHVTCDLTVKHPSVFDIKWTVSYGGRKECPDVGFQKRGSGKEACALLAKLVT